MLQLLLRESNIDAFQKYVLKKEFFNLDNIFSVSPPIIKSVDFLLAKLFINADRTIHYFPLLSKSAEF